MSEFAIELKAPMWAIIKNSQELSRNALVVSDTYRIFMETGKQGCQKKQMQPAKLLPVQSRSLLPDLQPTIFHENTYWDLHPFLCQPIAWQTWRQQSVPQRSGWYKHRVCDSPRHWQMHPFHRHLKEKIKSNLIGKYCQWKSTDL